LQPNQRLTLPQPIPKLGQRLACGLLLLFATRFAPPLLGQTDTADAPSEAFSPMPEAPAPATPVAFESSAGAFDQIPAGRYAKYIDPDQIAPHLTVHDKMVLGLRDAFSPASISVWFLVAGYEQATNGSPNWPQRPSGYLRRLGAAAARDSSDGIFTDSLFSALLRQDPRYYKVGRRRNFAYRTLYALTRPLITRTDGGHVAPNVSLIVGSIGGSVLTNTYYPTLNQGFDETAKTFGGSVGSAGLGDLVDEFSDGVLEALHLKRPH
jgi:hypothetical protein